MRVPSFLHACPSLREGGEREQRNSLSSGQCMNECMDRGLPDVEKSFI